MNQVTIGSISTGTLVPEELAEAFIGELEYLKYDGVETLRKEFENLVNIEELDNVIEEAQDALGELAPDYCYFGTLDGDGADFGFWISWDSVDMAVADGELQRVDELPELDHTTMCDKPLWLVVNDHGNATLYAARCGEGVTGYPMQMVEVWAVV